MARRMTDNWQDREDRWVLSYADFITLLFAFFVVLYAISSINEEKYSQLSEALADRFINIEPEVSDKRPQAQEILDIGFQPEQEPVTPQAEVSETISDFEAVEDSLNKLLDPLIQQGHAKVSNNALWLEIELRSSLLFESGSAKLSRQADVLLEQLAIMLAQSPNPITVEGFTDNQPVSSALFASNWELSVVRAASVVRLLSEFGVQPTRLAAVGYGEHRPAYSNRTEEGQKKNRRVVLVVARDQQVSRLMAAHGSELLTPESVGELLEAMPSQHPETPVIEQYQTERGGMLYRQAEQQSGHTQQEQ